MELEYSAIRALLSRYLIFIRTSSNSKDQTTRAAPISDNSRTRTLMSSHGSSGKETIKNVETIFLKRTSKQNLLSDYAATCGVRKIYIVEVTNKSSGICDRNSFKIRRVGDSRRRRFWYEVAFLLEPHRILLYILLPFQARVSQRLI